MEDGKFLILDCKSGNNLKYPKPENLVLGLQDSYKAGDIIGTAYNTSSPIIKLNALIKLFIATGSRGKRYYEKDNVLISECYAYNDGEIHYKESKTGDVIVEIGDQRYAYNPQCMYYYPEGTEIKKFQRICSGVVDMPRVVHRFGTNLQDIYIVFRKQFYTLQEGLGYIKDGVSSGALQEELCEILFASLMGIDYDSVAGVINDTKYLGTSTGIMNSNSFYTMLSYGYSSRVIKKALRGETEIKNDIMTGVTLGLLINNQLDKKNDKKY